MHLNSSLYKLSLLEHRRCRGKVPVDASFQCDKATELRTQGNTTSDVLIHATSKHPILRCQSVYDAT